jgi:hypothetical protein
MNVSEETAASTFRAESVIKSSTLTSRLVQEVMLLISIREVSRSNLDSDSYYPN